MDKISKLSTVTRKVFTVENRMIAIYERIRMLFSFFLTHSTQDITVELSKYLGVSDMKSLAQVSKQGQIHTEKAFINRAREWGLEGIYPTKEMEYQKAVAYLKCFFNLIDTFSSEYMKGAPSFQHLSVEKKLQAMKEFSLGETDKFLSIKELYLPIYKDIRKIFYDKVPSSKKEMSENSTNLYGNMAARLAIQYKDFNIIEMLIRCDVDLKVDNGLLSLAAYYKNNKAMSLLIQNRGDPNIPDKRGLFSLNYAVLIGDVKIMESVLRSGAKVNEPDLKHNTPLVYACCGYKVESSIINPEVVELLLQNGADPHILNKRGVSPLHYASRTGNAEVVNLLLKHDAKVDLKTLALNTPLAYACGSNVDASYTPNPKVVELLLQGGADPNIPTADGWSPLHCAVESGDVKIVELLLKYNANVNYLAQGHTTALAYACYGTKHKPNLKVVELLLQSGADPYIATENGETPLSLALDNNEDVIAKLLKKSMENCS